MSSASSSSDGVALKLAQYRSELRQTLASSRPEAASAEVDFHLELDKATTRGDTVISSIGDEHVPLLARLVQGSRLTLNALACECSSTMAMIGFRVEVSAITTKIKLIAERKAYGIRSTAAIGYSDESLLALWHWEVVSLELFEAAAPIRAARAQRTKTGKRLKALGRLVDLLQQQQQGGKEQSVKVAQEEEKIAKLDRDDEAARVKKLAADRKDAAKKEASDEKKRLSGTTTKRRRSSLDGGEQQQKNLMAYNFKKEVSPAKQRRNPAPLDSRLSEARAAPPSIAALKADFLTKAAAAAARKPARLDTRRVLKHIEFHEDHKPPLHAVQPRLETIRRRPLDKIFQVDYDRDSEGEWAASLEEQEEDIDDGDGDDNDADADADENDGLDYEDGFLRGDDEEDDDDEATKKKRRVGPPPLATARLVLGPFLDFENDAVEESVLPWVATFIEPPPPPPKAKKPANDSAGSRRKSSTTTAPKSSSQPGPKQKLLTNFFTKKTTKQPSPTGGGSSSS